MYNNITKNNILYDYIFLYIYIQTIKNKKCQVNRCWTIVFPVFSAAIITYKNVINYLGISAILFHFSGLYWNQIKTSSDLNFNGWPDQRNNKLSLPDWTLNINIVQDFQVKENILILSKQLTRSDLFDYLASCALYVILSIL